MSKLAFLLTLLLLVSCAAVPTEALVKLQAAAEASQPPVTSRLVPAIETPTPAPEHLEPTPDPTPKSKKTPKPAKTPKARRG